jgi:hypothetical protein
MHDLSHAYTVVLMVAIILVALMFLPAAFLPRKTGFHSRSTDAGACAIAVERSSMGRRP